MRLPRRRLVLIVAASTTLPFGAAVAASSPHQRLSPASAAPHRSPTVPPQTLPFHPPPANLTPAPHPHHEPHTIGGPGSAGPPGHGGHP